MILVTRCVTSGHRSMRGELFVRQKNPSETPPALRRGLFGVLSRVNTEIIFDRQPEHMLDL